MAVNHVVPGVIDEAAAHLEISRHDDLLLRLSDRIDLSNGFAVCVRGLDSGRNREDVPPNQVLRRRLRWNALRTASRARRLACCAARGTTGRRARFPGVWIIRIYIAL